MAPEARSGGLPMLLRPKEPGVLVTALEDAHALPAEFYRSSAWHEYELATVFADSWQLAAHSALLAGAGDHVVCEIAGRPLIIVRGEDGQLRGFDNVCRHRAGPLALCNGRAARALQCRYHGWTYALDGQLKAANEMQGARDFHVDTIRLSSVRVHEWEGLVFVALSTAAPPFSEVYQGIRERIGPHPLGALRHHLRIDYEVACNWKVYVDNYLEGYHLPFVHPDLTRVVDYRAYETELSDWYSLQHSPIRDAEGPYGAGHAWYYFVYPNTMLNIVPGRLQTNRVVPLGRERCRVEFEFFYAEEAGVEARIRSDQDFTEQIQREDMGICEHVQSGLMSGAYQAGRLCPGREAGVWHFQNLLRRAYTQSE
jgi:choline monooxygenase